MTKEKEGPKHKAGDKVMWSSGAGGFWTEKTGTIVAVVPKGESLSDVLRAAERRTVPATTIKAQDRSITAERYAIRVDRDGKTRDLDPHYYAPTVGRIDTSAKPARKKPARKAA